MSTIPRPDSAVRQLGGRLAPAAAAAAQRTGQGGNSNAPLLPAAIALFLLVAASGSLLRLGARMPERPGWG